MKGKCKSFKNLILIAMLFVLSIIMGALGSAGAYAETDYITAIENRYLQLKDVVSDYNGTEVLESIKSSSDYLIGYKVKDGDSEKTYLGSLSNNEKKLAAVYKEKMAQLDAISFVIDSIGIEPNARDEFKNGGIKTIVASKNSNDFTNVRWDDIKREEEKFINDMDILKLFSEGNLNCDYVKERYDQAEAIIEGVALNPEKEDLSAFKQEQKDLLDEEYNKFKASNYYSSSEDVTQQTVVSERGLDLVAAKALIDDKNTDSREKIIAIKSQFISRLRNSTTIVEECYNSYISLEAQGMAEELKTEQILGAIQLYGLISNKTYYLTDGRLVEIQVAHSRLLSIYRARKLAEVEDLYYEETEGEKLINRYSKKNSDEISKIIEEARVNILDMTEVADIDQEIKLAKEAAATVPTNVQAIVSKDSIYTVTITAVDNEYAFAPTAYVVVDDYEFYAVRQNVNRLLRKLEAGKNSDGKDLKYHVKYYIDFTIIDENGRELKEKEQKYEVKIEISDEMVKALGEDYKVVYYYNGVMDGYSKTDDGATLEDKYLATIETGEGGTVLKFTTTHFSPYALCGKTLANGAGLGALPIYQNPFFYAALILLAIITCIIILIILKHWKYKVVFKNNGGTRVKTRKFKKTEPIVMPSAPTKQGYIFGGWYTDKNLTKRFVQYRITKRKNIKLWAKWIPLNVEVASIDDYYQALRAALDDYERVGVQIGLKEEESVARIITSNNKVLLYVCGNAEKYAEMGYNVTTSTDEANKDIPVKFIVATEEDVYQGLELIDIAMKSKGFTDKPGDPEIKEISEEERKDGFIFTFKNEKVADTLKEWFEMLRLQAKSYVMVGDSGTPRDLNGKYIVKAKRYEDRIDLYLPVGNESSEDVSKEPLYKDVPNKFVIKTAEDVPMALEAIDESMTSIGMKKYPRNASQLKASGDSDTAFGYKIRFN